MGLGYRPLQMWDVLDYLAIDLTWEHKIFLINLAFWGLCVELVLSKDSEYIFEIQLMLCLRLAKDDDVNEINNNWFPNEWSKDGIHKGHKG